LPTFFNGIQAHPEKFLPLEKSVHQPMSFSNKEGKAMVDPAFVVCLM
jgi:hypothetical protein